MSEIEPNSSHEDMNESLDQRGWTITPNSENNPDDFVTAYQTHIADLAHAVEHTLKIPITAENIDNYRINLEKAKADWQVLKEVAPPDYRDGNLHIYEGELQEATSRLRKSVGTLAAENILHDD